MYCLVYVHNWNNNDRHWGFIDVRTHRRKGNSYQNKSFYVQLIKVLIYIKYGDRMWPLFIIGTLLFLPGFYHVRIAYYAWMKYEGFSFDDIPNDD